MRAFLLTLDAPLMSFGAEMIDQKGVIQPWPALSMLVGLLSNALGYRRGYDAALHQRLQERLRYAVRCDRLPTPLQDYQTVDLGQPHLLADLNGWTTWGRIATRAGAFSKGTHQRYRDYHANAKYTVAITLDAVDEAPTLDDLREALRRPVRPLFIGRKTCLPAAPLIKKDPFLTADTLFNAVSESAGQGTHIWWTPAPDEALPKNHRWHTTTDQRDWANAIHGGQRMVYETVLEAPDE